MELDPIKLHAAIAKRKAAKAQRIASDKAAQTASAPDPAPDEKTIHEIIKLRLSPDKTKCFIGVIQYPSHRRFFFSVERSNNGLTPGRHPFAVHPVADGMKTVHDVTGPHNPPVHRAFTLPTVFFSETSIRESVIALANSNL